MSAYSDHVAALSGIQSYWRLAESSGSMIDEKGIVNLTVGSAITRAVTGLLGGGDTNAAAQGTASSSNSSLSAGDNFGFAGLPFTFAIIIKPSSVTTVQRIAEKLSTSGGNGWQIILRSTDGKVSFTTGAPSATVINSLALTAGTTYLLVVTNTGDTSANGQKIHIIPLTGAGAGVRTTSQTTANSAVVTNTNPMRIGIPSIASTASFSGVMDEAFFLNRVMGTSEIDELYGFAVASAQTVSPSSIASAEAVGTPTISTTGTQTVSPSSIASGEAVGTPTVSFGATQTVSPSSIPSAEAVGTPSIAQRISPAAITTGVSFGTPTVTANPTITVRPSGFGGESLGTPTVTNSGPTTVSPSGIPSGESFGTPRIIVAGAAADVAPREVLWDPVTDTSYEWAVNHSTEDTLRIGIRRELGGPSPVVASVRQQSYDGSLKLHLEGFILAEAQLVVFNDFFDACDSEPLVYRDAAGDEYVVTIAALDAPKLRRHDSHYWRYTMELAVLTVLSGPYVGVT